MPKNMIEQIKATETQAYQIRVDAEKTAKETVAEALAEAEQIRGDMAKQSKQRASEMLADARKEAENTIDAGRIAAYQNASVMKDAVSGKAKEAIDIIIERILAE